MAMIPTQRQSKIDPRLMMALQAQQRGSSTEPVHSPLEGLARAGTGIAGAWQASQIMDERDAEQAKKYKVLSDALQQGMSGEGGFGGIAEQLAADPETVEFALPLLEMEMRRQADLDMYRQRQAMEKPSSVQEYEYARQGGFQGSYQDWISSKARANQAPVQSPASVREWQYYNSLPREDQQRYLAMKRSQQYLNLGDRFAMPDPNQPGQEAGSFPRGLPPERDIQDDRIVTVPGQPGAQGAPQSDQSVFGTPLPGGDQAPQGVPPAAPGAPGVTDLPPSASQRREDEEAEAERRAAAEGKASVSAFTLRDAREIQERIPKLSDIAMARKGLAQVPGTEEYAANAFIESMRGTIGIEQLLNIKRQGSGLGQVPQSQLNMLADLMGRLDIGLPKDVMQTLITDIQDRYQEIIGSMTPEDRAMVGLAERELRALTGEEGQTGGSQPTGAPSGAAGWSIQKVD